MSSRKKRRRQQHEYGPLLDELFGGRAARRMRTLAVLSIVLLLLGGWALFLFESQTFGRIAIALGIGWGLFWMGVRHVARPGSDLFQTALRGRWPLVSSAVLLIGAGWVVFLTAWEELGLLLVLLGAVPLLILIAGARREPLLSPMDGPPFGDTGPT
jgi:hypothetical protein